MLSVEEKKLVFGQKVAFSLSTKTRNRSHQEMQVFATSHCNISLYIHTFIFPSSRLVSLSSLPRVEGGEGGREEGRVTERRILIQIFGGID
jgi:hypothetical protein